MQEGVRDKAKQEASKEKDEQTYPFPSSLGSKRENNTGRDLQDLFIFYFFALRAQLCCISGHVFIAFLPTFCHVHILICLARGRRCLYLDAHSSS